MFSLSSPVQISESFRSECVRVWSGNLPELIFSVFSQGIHCPLEGCTQGRGLSARAASSRLSEAPEKVCLGLERTWLRSPGRTLSS